MRTRVLLVFVSLLIGLSTPARAEDQFFDSDGVKIRYTIAGQGEPVLLIHGFTANIQVQWELPGIIKALAEDYQVIALDNRGHGKSGKPHDAEKYGMAMVEDAVRLLDQLKIEKAHVVGYSMGAIITSNLIVKHPDRLLSATLGGSGGLREGVDLAFFDQIADSLEQGRGMGAMIEQLTPPGRPKLAPEQVKALNTLLTLTNDTKALAAVLRGFKELRVPIDKLKSNKVPTLALIGADDTLKRGVEDLDGRMANVQIVVVDNADHMTAFTKPEFIKALRAFLDKHRTSEKAKAPATVAPK